MVKKILIAPAHYLVDHESRSEFYFVGKLIYDLAKMSPDVKYYVICGRCKNAMPDNVRIFELFGNESDLDLNLYTRSLFFLKVFIKSVQLSFRNKFDIVWHLFPNGRYSFNPYIFFQIDRLFNPKVKRVAGRLQYAKHDITGYTENFSVESVRIQSFELNPVIKRVHKILFNVLIQFSDYYFNLFDVLIFNNQAAVDYYKTFVLKKILPRYTKIPVGVDLTKFSFYEKNFDHKLNLLYAGLLNATKRVDEVIKICNKINTLGVDFHLDVVGDGEKRVELEALVDRLNLRDRITFYGNVAKSEMPNFYKKAHFLFSLSSNESFGQVFIESWATGTIFVGSTIPVYAEVIRDFENGLLFNVENGDHEAIAKKIVSIRQNSFNKITKTAFDEVGRYDWLVITNKYYAEIV